MIRHLTGDPPSLAQRAAKLLASEERLVLTDVIAAECVYVLESFYEVDRAEIAELMRATIGFRSIDAPGSSTLLRALDLYEDGSDFTDSYLVACAENSGINAIASFDRGIDRVGTVRRID